MGILYVATGIQAPPDNVRFNLNEGDNILSLGMARVALNDNGDRTDSIFRCFAKTASFRRFSVIPR